MVTNPIHSLQNLISRFAHKAYTSFWPSRFEINRSRRKSIRQLKEFNALSLSKQEQLMLSSLQELTKYCRAEVPYYKELLKNFPPDFPLSFEEYRQIPPLDKDIIRTNGDSLISQKYVKEKLIKYSTGGSTGEPISVYISKADHGIGEAVNQVFLESVGGKPGNRIGTLYGGNLDTSLTPSLERRVKNWLWNFSEHGCFRLDEQYLLEVHKDLEKFQPDILLGYSSAIYLLALKLKSMGVQPSYPRYSIVTAAEKLEGKHRIVIESVFKVEIIERYGSRDSGLMAWQNPGDSRFWIDLWSCLIEPERFPSNNEDVPILITRLGVRGMPLLRYRNGDLAKFPSGWTLQSPVRWLEEITGRVLDFIYLPDGRIVHGSEFPHLFKDFDIILYQVRQEENGNVIVSILPGVRFNQQQRERCEQVIRENLIGLPITFRYGTEFERTSQNKLRPVMSNYRRKF